MKRPRVRNMRDIPTIQGLRDRSVPASREQTVTEIARLEHEKARLERERDMWVSNQKKTEERLLQVEERMTRLQEALDPPAVDGTKQRTVRRSPGEKVVDGEEHGRGWREMPLEY